MLASPQRTGTGQRSKAFCLMLGKRDCCAWVTCLRLQTLVRAKRAGASRRSHFLFFGCYFFLSPPRGGTLKAGTSEPRVHECSPCRGCRVACSRPATRRHSLGLNSARDKKRYELPWGFFGALLSHMGQSQSLSQSQSESEMSILEYPYCVLPHRFAAYYQPTSRSVCTWCSLPAPTAPVGSSW